MSGCEMWSSQRKFLSLPEAQRHKKCAELLRSIYIAMQDGGPVAPSMEAYAQLARWLDLPALQEGDAGSYIRAIADRYHLHAQWAQLHHKEHRLLPRVRQGDRAAALPAWPIALYLDNIRSAHNVGSMLRTVEAFSLGSVHFSPATPYIDHKQVKDAAMGAAEWIDCRKDSRLDDLPRPIIALETSDEAQSIYDFTFPDAFTLVVGNEEYGCSAHTLDAADVIVEIPLRGRKNSLNVANALAIAAAEIYRQRTHHACTLPKLKDNL